MFGLRDLDLEELDARLLASRRLGRPCGVTCDSPGTSGIEVAAIAPCVTTSPFPDLTNSAIAFSVSPSSGGPAW